MKKILLISNHGGGFYNFKKELVEELLSTGYEVHFAVPYDEKVNGLKALGAEYHEIDIDRRGMNPLKDLSLTKQFIQLIKSVKPDCLVLHTIKPNIYASVAAGLYGIPYINNITGLGSALQVNGFMAKVLRLMYRTSLRKSSGIFFENAGNMQYFMKYKIGNPDRYIVVPGAGVNTVHYSPDQSKHKEEADPVTFLYIARIMKEKGIEEFFDAAERMKEKEPNVRFQIIGWYDETGYKNRMDQLLRDGVIEYHGVSSDTRAEMAKADCIVLPSYHEGMSNVLLEGAAMGLPLITTDIPGCREAVEAGKTGFLCKAKESGSLIDGMERFLALSPEERERMGLCGREKMVAEFDRRLVVERYTAAIRKAIGEQ